MSACLTKALLVSEWPERIDVVSEPLGATWSLDDNAARAAALPVAMPGEAGIGCSGRGASRELGLGIYTVFRTSLRPRTVPTLRFGVANWEDLKVLATFDSAACASASCSGIGSFLISSLN